MGKVPLILNKRRPAANAPAGSAMKFRPPGNKNFLILVHTDISFVFVYLKKRTIKTN